MRKPIQQWIRLAGLVLAMTLSCEALTGCSGGNNDFTAVEEAQTGSVAISGRVQ